MSKKGKVKTEVRVPDALLDELLVIANLAGVTLEAVICVALATEVHRWHINAPK